MVNQELIDNIVIRFKQGEHSAQIREGLIDEGVSEGDIDAAFRHIRYSALQQIPIVADINHWLTTLDSKTSDLTPKQLMLVFAGIGVAVLIVATLLYFILDPLGTRAIQRDKEREQTFVQLHNGIDKYNAAHHTYPKMLSQLVPQYLADVPVDPKTKIPYDYKITDAQGDYQLCATFENEPAQCVSSNEDTSIPVVTEDPSGGSGNSAADTSSTDTYILNGKVYADANQNAQPEPEESGVSGIEIKVEDTANKTVCDEKTDSTGIFMCNIAVQGDYKVSVTVPQGMKATQNNPITITVPDKNNPITKASTVYFGIATAGQVTVQSSKHGVTPQPKSL